MTVLRRVGVVVLGVIVLAALVLPADGPLTPLAFVRIPVEALVGIALLLVLPTRARTPVAAALGALLGLLTLLGVLHVGFRSVLGRSFDPVVDAPLFADGMRFLSGNIGRPAAVAVAVLAGLLALALPVGMAVAVVRLGRIVVRRRTGATRLIAVLTPIWIGCALIGAQLVPGVPVAAAGAAALARDTAVGIPASVAAQEDFAAHLGEDPFRAVPSADLLTALRGKDVVVAFVESYGRSAVENPEFAAPVGSVLDEGTARLGAAGFATRSAYLTSPVAGGSSWLAHATFLSGLHVSDQGRYDSLVTSDRRTLTSTFAEAGWRTLAVQPGTTSAWPEARYYGFSDVLDYGRLDYRGPDRGWASVPDQYTLSAFHRLTARAPGAPPVMAEIDLVSSHAPWRMIPPVIGWDTVGDGTVYGPLAGTGDPDAIWGQGTTAVRDAYRRSIEYSLGSLVSYVQTYGDDNLVLLILGDHQPAPLLTGDGASRDVPISVVTRDRGVLDRIAPWGWTDGLRPGAAAPVWPMEAFRDRFLTAFRR
ncbi:sulfatase [Pseudonocardia sp. CA-107938]|uniref:sulfatase n=1 Tax=Pseudonocardia sp. CA-107938 TaxID=3240021 RepID=UPI003D8FD0FF